MEAASFRYVPAGQSTRLSKWSEPADRIACQAIGFCIKDAVEIVRDDRRALQTILDGEVPPDEIPTDKDSTEDKAAWAREEGSGAVLKSGSLSHRDSSRRLTD
jgi:ferredoxin